MRTKNAKRLWPVPATLTVVALAVFLAFGLMATTGAQPAAAQDDPDCKIVIVALGNIDADDSDTMCDAFGDTAVLEISGASDQTMERTVSLLIEDKSGSITAYPTVTLWNTQITPNGLADGSNSTSDRVTSMKYRYQLIKVPPAEPNPSSGMLEGQKVSVMVQGNVHYRSGTADVTAAILGIPTGNAASGALAVSDETTAMTITYLGTPAIGKDGADHNKKVDDADLEQCVVGTDPTSKRVVDEAETCVSAGDDLIPAQTWIDSTAVTDGVETRSKLVIRTGTGVDGVGDATVIFDGKKATHTLTNSQAQVTIFALVQDAKGNNLLEQAVDFNATTIPDDIVASRKLSDDPETQRVVTGIPTDTDEEIQVAGLNDVSANVGTMVSAEALISPGDAVAAFTLSNLPIDTSYLVTVEVAVGSLKLGTVQLARTGSPEKVVAGVFNIECFDDPNDDGDYSDATFDAEAKGCDDSGMADRFGRGQMFVVKAHHEDALDLVVGDGVDLSSEFASDDDDLLGDADPVDINDPVDPTNGDPAQAWLYTIDDEATLGNHMITVSTDATDKDKDAIASVTLTVSVAGPPDDYMISGPDNIDLGGRGMFTVTAVDANDGIPHFITAEGEEDKNDTVEVVVPDIAQSLVRGSDLVAGTLTLDADTGMGTFTIYAPSNAPDGSTARIFVSAGDVEITHTVMFGMALTEPGMPMNVMAMATSHDMITVTWESPAADGDITGYMVQSAYMMADDMMSDWMDVDPAHMGMDMMYMDMGLMAETTYYYRVAAMNSVGMGDYSDGMVMAMTMMMPPMELGAAMDLTAMANDDDSITLMWTPGDNATHHFVSGNVSVVWEFADGMNMHTVSADQLVSGTEPTDLSEGMFSEKVAGDATSANMDWPD